MLPNSNSILQVADLAIGYGRVPLAAGLNFTVSKGQLLAVVGHNGSGKSSLVRTLLGLKKPLAGTVEWRESRAAYLGQGQRLDRSFPMKTFDLVTSGGWRMEGWRAMLGLGQQQSADRLYQHALRAVDRVGLSTAKDLPLHALSGGQLQRALFARAMVQDAPAIILDEPFAGVDQKTEADLLQIILDWCTEGRAVMMVSHDLSAVMNHANAVLLLGQGQSRYGEPCETLTHDALVELGYMNPGKAQWLAGIYGGAQSHG